MTAPKAKHPSVGPVTEAIEVIRQRTRLRPGLGVVLGSGFGGVAAAVENGTSFAFTELPGFVSTTVPGHEGRLVVGLLGDVPVAVLSGRAHFYEGHDLATVVYPIRVFAALRVRSVLLTNAAGGIRSDLFPGDFVAFTDHVNLLGANPLRGPGGAERFVDLSLVYSGALLELLARAATTAGVELKRGVYAAVAGPSYETPAEIRALGILGADMVGMSTVPEAIVARQCGLEVAGLSCISNRAAGLAGPISHREVLAVGRESAERALGLVTRFAQLHAQHDAPAENRTGG